VETKANTMRRSGRKPQGTEAPLDAAQPVELRLTTWSMALPELAECLQANAEKFELAPHSTQYRTLKTTRAFGEELRKLAISQMHRYQTLVKESKSGRKESQRSADVFESVQKRLDKHMAAPAPAPTTEEAIAA
jgi:hypothetical protein